VLCTAVVHSDRHTCYQQFFYTSVTVKFLCVVLLSAILFVLWFVFVFLGCSEWLLVHVSVQLIASKDCL